ncbi:MAG: hypothetical protein MUF38_08390 [Anaerolineae bacterium]|jgi:hypothetical protein|nr:hypothetical protein [Anaerolineae bacterium]
MNYITPPKTRNSTSVRRGKKPLVDETSIPQTTSPTQYLFSTPQHILGLQRTVGNKATQRIIELAQPTNVRPKSAVIQRALTAAVTYHAISTQIEALVDIYNNLAAPTNPAQYQASFNALQAVEREIYAWFDDFSQNNQRFTGSADVTAIKSLLDEVNTEHSALIDGSKDLDQVLPFDPTGLLPNVVNDMKTLWQDIVNSRGKIKLVGSDPNKQQALSELGRLLSTDVGRRMLSLLNAPTPGKAKGVDSSLTDIFIGETKNQLPNNVQNASPDVEDLGFAVAQPIGTDDTNKNSTIEKTTAVSSSKIGFFKPKANDYPAVAPGQLHVLRDSAWDGKKGFTYNGRKYKFNNKSRGAFVTNPQGNAIHPGKGHGNQILTPSWVTMGHELGHAANMRTGATTLKTNELMGLSGPGNNEHWDNPEELLNIENVENALRGEVGLSERDGHRPPQWLLMMGGQVKQKIRRPLGLANEVDNNLGADPEFTTLWQRAGSAPAKEVVTQEFIAPYKIDLKDFLDRKAAHIPNIDTIYNNAMGEVDNLF